ncbi:lipase family protein [Microbacterium hominis]|uniref:DUF308 domain-containing protein n=1 Tax=Microbacterium hominis TaxID=162426 RepID=A0A7D4TG09_9MICO|nr:lipase family protein [Microbacterium hominis]QKJ19860.1 DUF308 domain-containing protein [Microbacterium hominis]
MADTVPGPRRIGWSVLPSMLRQAPARVLVLVGVGLALIGFLIATRPLTSLFVLGIYIGLSAIASGLAELALPRGQEWWHRAIAAAWMLGGAAVLVWFGRSLDILPSALAVLLMLGGLASFGDALTGGRVSERVLAVAWGGAQIVFGVLALTWPDVTVLVVAFVFGIRTLLFGAALAIRGTRQMVAAGRGAAQREPSRAARRWADAGRFALAVLLLVTAGAAWWVNDWLADGAPVVDGFYDPPAELPDGRGVLIREDDYGGRQPRGASVHRILYTTQDARGADAVASALVIIPDRVSFNPRDVVLWNHGTTGVARGCAPSLREASATRWAIPGLDEAIENDWIVVAPDYIGQGAPGVFPYLIGVGEARSALDAVRAADEVVGVWLTRDVAVWGHSQGGHAALWTAAVAEDYAPDLRILGTAALSPAADPLALAEELTTIDATPTLSVLISWVLVPYADTYPDVSLDDYVVPGARAIVREMAQRCPSEPGVIVSVLAAIGVSEDRPLFVGDLTTGSLGRRLGENAATGPWNQPLLVAWGSDDEVIPPDLQRRFIAETCEAGAQVRWLEYRGYDHLGILLPSSSFVPVLVNWTQQRFDGDPPPVDNCDE